MGGKSLKLQGLPPEFGRRRGEATPSDKMEVGNTCWDIAKPPDWIVCFEDITKDYLNRTCESAPKVRQHLPNDISFLYFFQIAKKFRKTYLQIWKRQVFERSDFPRVSQDPNKEPSGAPSKILFPSFAALVHDLKKGWFWGGGLVLMVGWWLVAEVGDQHKGIHMVIARGWHMREFDAFTASFFRWMMEPKKQGRSWQKDQLTTKKIGTNFWKSSCFGNEIIWPEGERRLFIHNWLWRCVELSLLVSRRQPLQYDWTYVSRNN